MGNCCSELGKFTNPSAVTSSVQPPVPPSLSSVPASITSKEVKEENAIELQDMKEIMAKKTISPPESKKKSKRKKQSEQWWITDESNANDEKMIAHLKKDNFADVAPFTFEGKLIPARIELHDGDTGNICFFYQSERQKRSMRLFGVDAPELKRKIIRDKSGKENKEHQKNRELETKAGHHVLKQLDEWIRSINPHSLVWVKFTKEEKYGRLMGKIWIISPEHEDKPTGTEPDVCKWLLEKKYAKPYFGKKKEAWTNKELEYILAH